MKDTFIFPGPPGTESCYGSSGMSQNKPQKSWVGERTLATSDRAGPLLVRKTALGKNTGEVGLDQQGSINFTKHLHE